MYKIFRSNRILYKKCHPFIYFKCENGSIVLMSPFPIILELRIFLIFDLLLLTRNLSQFICMNCIIILNFGCYYDHMIITYILPLIGCITVGHKQVTLSFLCTILNTMTIIVNQYFANLTYPQDSCHNSTLDSNSALSC